MKFINLHQASLAMLISVVFISCENTASKTADAVVTESKKAAKASNEAAVYTFTKESEVSFIGAKITKEYLGGFKNVTGSFALENGEPVSGSATIDMSSIYTGIEKLTHHLKNEDFFNVTTHPNAKFTVTSFKKINDKKYNVSGNFKMVGVENNITFPATIESHENSIVKLSAKFDIDRHDWKINYPGKPDDLIKDRVVIGFSLTAKKDILE